MAQTTGSAGFRPRPASTGPPRESIFSVPSGGRNLQAEWEGHGVNSWPDTGGSCFPCPCRGSPLVRQADALRARLQTNSVSRDALAECSASASRLTVEVIAGPALTERNVQRGL